MNNLKYIYKLKKRSKKSKDCILWTGNLTDRGYGQMQFHGKRTYVHRISYAINIGPIPEGMFICHTCDVRNCINPEHLFLGTAKENIQDMVRKGRNKTKLSKEQVLEIREKYKPCKSKWDKNCYSMSKLAKEYRVGIISILKILQRKTWRHI